MNSTITLIYDGQCPLCNAYVRHTRLKQAGELTLLDARQHPELVHEYQHKGLDLDQGMIVQIGDNTYHGADAVHMLALLTSRVDIFNRLNAATCFLRCATARLIYPLLRAGRLVLLKLLGIKRLTDTSQGSA